MGNPGHAAPHPSEGDDQTEKCRPAGHRGVGGGAGAGVGGVGGKIRKSDSLLRRGRATPARPRFGGPLPTVSRRCNGEKKMTSGCPFSAQSSIAA